MSQLSRAQEVLPISVYRVRDPLAFVAGVVAVRIRLRGVPGFVGVERVDVKEEWLVLGVLLQPMASPREGSRAEPVAFLLPVGDVAKVLPHGQLRFPQLVGGGGQLHS